MAQLSAIRSTQWMQLNERGIRECKWIPILLLGREWCIHQAIMNSYGSLLLLMWHQQGKFLLPISSPPYVAKIEFWGEEL